MPEFCTCGSIIINDHCTNKNCSNRPAAKTASTKSSTGRKTGALKKEPKKITTRRASKCITYNLYDLERKKEEDT